MRCRIADHQKAEKQGRDDSIKQFSIPYIFSLLFADADLLSLHLITLLIKLTLACHLKFDSADCDMYVADII